jgi:hypothetical protein
MESPDTIIVFNLGANLVASDSQFPSSVFGAIIIEGLPFTTFIESKLKACMVFPSPISSARIPPK